jgi:hypothetical protein
VITGSIRPSKKNVCLLSPDRSNFFHPDPKFFLSENLHFFLNFVSLWILTCYYSTFCHLTDQIKKNMG